MNPKTTTVFAPITKTERGDDGNLYVYGKMTGPDLDMDGQRMDPTWLATAVPEWFNTGANIRQMHQAIAVGKGAELEQDGDDWWLTAKVVDPAAQKLVDEGVLTGFSIGIKGPKLRKDAEAPNGWIVGGKIIENSLVDRPCNETAKLVLAKTVTGDAGPELVEVEEIELVKAGEPDDAAEEAQETDLIAQARAALTGLVAQEADEFVEGEGTASPLRILLGMLDDLSWYEQVDSMEDVQAAIAAMTNGAAMPMTMSALADLTKAATADTATAEERAELAILRKVLVDDYVDGRIAAELTKAATAEDLEKVTQRLAKVEDTVVTTGPTRVRTPEDLHKSAAMDADLRKAAEYELTASTIDNTQPDMAAGYRDWARQLRAKHAATT